MANSLLSGSIGIPDGAYRLMNDPVQRAVEQIVKNELEIRTIIQEGGTGGTTERIWARVVADGTKVAGSDGDIITPSRTAAGVYPCTSSKSFASSGGYYQYGVLVTPSSQSGSGGDGASPFKAFDTYQAVATDTSADPVWQYNETNGKFYLLGSNADDVFIHTDSTWTTAPVQVDADAVAIRVSGQSGGLSHEGAYVWISGDGYPVRVMRVSDNTMFNFGGTPTHYVLCATDNLNTLAGSGVSGPRVWFSEGSDVKAYDPDITGESLGSVQLTYSSLAVGSNALPAQFDKDGYIWISQGTALKQASPIAATFVNHAFPTETPTGETLAASLGGASRLAYDSVRNVIYMCLISSDPNTYLYTYTGWTNGVANSGVWGFIAKFSGRCSIHYEQAQDLLFVVNQSNSLVYRYAGYPKIRIDTVSVDDTTPDNSQIDYDLNSSYMCWYKSDSTGDYGYVSATKGASNYLIKISYNGANLSPGDGGSVLGNALHAMYAITSGTAFTVYIFRSISPPILADGEFTVDLTYG